MIIFPRPKLILGLHDSSEQTELRIHSFYLLRFCRVQFEQLIAFEYVVYETAGPSPLEYIITVMQTRRQIEIS